MRKMQLKLFLPFRKKNIRNSVEVKQDEVSLKLFYNKDNGWKEQK